MEQKSKLNYYQQLLKLKRPIVPLRRIPRPQNHHKITWRNKKQMICQTINSQSKCFCGHPFNYHEHNTITNCTVLNCQCSHFQYIPSSQFQCICGHSYRDHQLNSKACTKNRCMKCSGFTSRWVCYCGHKFQGHKVFLQTLYQTDKKGRDPQKVERDPQKIGNESAIMSESEKIIAQRKKKCLERVNQKFKEKNQNFVHKYSTPFMNKYLDMQQNNYKTPYQLYMQPHQYRFIKLPLIYQKHQ